MVRKEGISIPVRFQVIRTQDHKLGKRLDGYYIRKVDQVEWLDILLNELGESIEKFLVSELAGFLAKFPDIASTASYAVMLRAGSKPTPYGAMIELEGASKPMLLVSIGSRKPRYDLTIERLKKDWLKWRVSERVNFQKFVSRIGAGERAIAMRAVYGHRPALTILDRVNSAKVISKTFMVPENSVKEVVLARYCEEEQALDEFMLYPESRAVIKAAISEELWSDYFADLTEEESSTLAAQLCAYIDTKLKIRSKRY